MANSNSKSDRAKVATVDFGFLTLEGLMSSDGEFAISVPQICELFSFLNKNAVRDIKALLGEDFPFLKWSSELNSKAVNVITLLTFEKLIFELAIKGNTVAIGLNRACIGLSLQQRYCDAFGIKFELEERNNWTELRRKGKVTRRT